MTTRNREATLKQSFTLFKQRLQGNVTFKKLIKIANRLGRQIQTLIVTFLLAFLYLIGFGLTKLWISIFHRGSFDSGKKGSVSFWLPVENDVFDSHDSDRQS